MAPTSDAARNWASVRTIFEGLILAALVWLGDNTTTMKVQLATLQAQQLALTAQLADVADLKSRVSALERDQAAMRAAVVNNTEALREMRQRADR